MFSMFSARTVIVSCAAFAALTLNGGAPASAQSLGLWGGWNEQGQGWQGTGPSDSQAGRSSGLFSDPYDRPFPALMDGGPRPEIVPEPPEIVAFPNTEAEGTIVIDNDSKRLYYVLDQELAYAYPISVGRDGFTWTGAEAVSRIAPWPDWHPPQEMRIRDPKLPVQMTGGIKNPLGAVSIYLGNSLYRIHGTNDPKTIGYAASSGCFRMLNAHAVHLAGLVHVGTVVRVVDGLEALRAPGDALPGELPWREQPAPRAAASSSEPPG